MFGITCEFKNVDNFIMAVHPLRKQSIQVFFSQFPLRTLVDSSLFEMSIKNLIDDHKNSGCNQVRHICKKPKARLKAIEMFLASIAIFETEWHYFVSETTNFLIRRNTCVLKHQRSILLYWASGDYSYLRWKLALWWDNECFILFSGWYFICSMPYVGTFLTIIVCRSKSFFKHIKAIKKSPGLV